jgi:hypothetical protein
MKKTFLYKLFGIGKMPAPDAAAVRSEDVILFDEGFKGTKTYINFRSPWRYSNWKRQWFTASIAMTGTRLIAFQYALKMIDAAFSDERFGGLKFSIEADGALLVAFDASLFLSHTTGNLEHRFFTPLAREFFTKITEKPGR